MSTATGTGTGRSPDDVSYPVTLTTADGIRLDIPVPDGGDVVTAAREAGLILPSQCGQDTCGSCHATARGAFRLGPHSPAALPPEQEAAGAVLLCRTYPLGGVQVQVSYPRSRIVDGGIGRRDGAARVRDGAVRLATRTALDRTPRYPG